MSLEALRSAAAARAHGDGRTRRPQIRTRLLRIHQRCKEPDTDESSLGIDSPRTDADKNQPISHEKAQKAQREMLPIERFLFVLLVPFCGHLSLVLSALIRVHLRLPFFSESRFPLRWCNCVQFFL